MMPWGVRSSKPKVDRSAFLYLPPAPPKEKFAQCATCILWVPDRELCAIHGDKVHVPGTASCGLYIHGGPIDGLKIIKDVTPQESGLVDREVRCENCKWFAAPKTCGLFVKLNKLPEWSLNETVDPYACCNANSPKD